MQLHPRGVEPQAAAGRRRRRMTAAVPLASSPSTASLLAATAAGAVAMLLLLAAPVPAAAFAAAGGHRRAGVAGFVPGALHRPQHQQQGGCLPQAPARAARASGKIGPGGRWCLAAQQQTDVDAKARPPSPTAAASSSSSSPQVASGATRDVDQGAIISGVEAAFRYSTAEERRAASEPQGDEPVGLKILLMGKPCSGKGTQAPLMGRKYRTVHISTGNLLRSEIQSETELGLIAKEQMEKGELLPDELMIALVKKRVSAEDCKRNGWILDGFPRTVRQAKLMQKAGIEPDVVIELDRPDEMVIEWCLGRYHDASTGVIYHPKFNPPPPEIIPRLIWRTDDTPDTLARRLQIYKDKTIPIYELYRPIHYRVNSAKNELEVLADINTILKEAAAKRDPSKLLARDALEDNQDVPPQAPQAERGDLLDAVTRCNEYNLKDYLPVYVGQVLVGFAHHDFVSELTLVQQGQGVRVELDSYVELAPGAKTPEQRTRMLADVVESLVASGAIKKEKIRNELMDVRPMLSPNFKQDPLLRLERGAMIKFGVPSHGVHINGYVRNPDNPRDIKIWVGKRSPSKATYPGLLDVIAAGGQPSGLTFRENAFKEAEEEASIPASMLEQNLLPAGMISYRYQTKHGLSTKFLKVYDLELQEGFIPYNGDGEVESFTLMPLDQALESLEKELYKWKPNAALTVLDFAVRHGAVDTDHDHYIEICHLLRGAFTDKKAAQGQRSNQGLFFGAY